MKRNKLWNRWLWGAGIVSLISVGSASYGYRQLIQIPQNLKALPATATPDERHQQSFQSGLTIVKKMGRSPRAQDGSVTASLSKEDLNKFFLYSVVGQSEEKTDPSGNFQPLLNKSIVKATQVEIDGTTLTTTALLDLSQVSADQLQGGNRLSLLRRLIKIPGLRDRTIAVTIQGQPKVEDRALVIQNPVVSIGHISLTQASAIKWLGISEAMLQESINQEWKNLPIELNSVKIVGQDLQLKGQLTAW
jgi:hypothetical protein